MSPAAQAYPNFQHWCSYNSTPKLGFTLSTYVGKSTNRYTICCLSCLSHYYRMWHMPHQHSCTGVGNLDRIGPLTHNFTFLMLEVCFILFDTSQTSQIWWLCATSWFNCNVPQNTRCRAIMWRRDRYLFLLFVGFAMVVGELLWETGFWIDLPLTWSRMTFLMLICYDMNWAWTLE